MTTRVRSSNNDGHILWMCGGCFFVDDVVFLWTCGYTTHRLGFWTSHRLSDQHKQPGFSSISIVITLIYYCYYYNYCLNNVHALLHGSKLVAKASYLVCPIIAMFG